MPDGSEVINLLQNYKMHNQRDCRSIDKYSPEGLRILFCEKLTEKEWERIHFSEVSKNDDEYVIAAQSGYVMCVTSPDKNAEEARKKAYSLVDKIVLPRMFYRYDIGLKFIEKDQKLLKKRGYL